MLARSSKCPASCDRLLTAGRIAPTLPYKHYSAMERPSMLGSLFPFSDVVGKDGPPRFTPAAGKFGTATGSRAAHRLLANVRVPLS
jgi:hypothetical protein